MKRDSKLIYVVCGPTASYKTDLAHTFAKKINGELIGADSMQIYKELPILTSSPSNEYKSEINYHMCNFLSISENYSVMKYIEDVGNIIKTISMKNITPIVVGGTGLYIDNLINGYNYIPAINEKIRIFTRKLQETLGQKAFFEKLESIDSNASNKLQAADKARSLRALEVFIQTGKSLCDFQAEEKHKILKDFIFKIICIHPNREFLYQNCNKRLENIFVNGAIDELNNIKKNFDINNVNLNALGAKQILSYLNGEITIKEALTDAKTKTRQYAKRQVTWFKHKLKNPIEVTYSNYDEYMKLDLSKF